MRDNVDILGVFHDGSIVEVRGELPSISFRIEIEYLRNMFPSEGDSFIAHVEGCESITFLNWENEQRTSSFKEIESEEPEILSIEQNGEIAHIICSTGELDILYNELRFELDTGPPVSFQDLSDACNKYWDDWESRKNS